MRDDRPALASKSQLALLTETRLAAYVMALLGLFMCLGGRVRFGAPGLQAAREVPYWPYSWGTLLIVLAGVLLYMLYTVRPRGAGAALLLISMWHSTFSILGFVSAYHNPEASLHAPFIYAAVGGFFAFRAGAYLGK